VQQYRTVLTSAKDFLQIAVFNSSYVLFSEHIMQSITHEKMPAVAHGSLITLTIDKRYRRSQRNSLLSRQCVHCTLFVA